MESIKQTAEERYIWNSTMFLNPFLFFCFLITGGTHWVWSVFLFYNSRAAAVVNVIMEIVWIYTCTITILSPWLQSLKNIWISSTYSWCKNQNTFPSLMQRNTGYYHSTRGPKCNPLLRTVCRYIVNIKNKFLCKYVFFFHKVWNKYL